MPRTPQHARHPVESLLRQSVYAGEKPDLADVEALNLPAAERRRFDAAVNEGLTLWKQGARGEANQTALEASKDIIHDLPERLKDPSYNDPDDPMAALTDPAELAAAIPRGGIADLQIPTTN